MSRKLAGDLHGYPANFFGATRAPGGEMLHSIVYDV
jgi:hypothetical protein